MFLFLAILLVSSPFQAILAEIVSIKPGGQFTIVKSLVPGDPIASKFDAKLHVFNDDIISIEMLDPSNKKIYNAENKKEDSFSFSANREGDHRVRLMNTGSTMKTVQFFIKGEESDGTNSQGGFNVNLII